MGSSKANGESARPPSRRVRAIVKSPGVLLGMLRFADLNTDLDLLDEARAVAQTLLREQPQIAGRHLQRWLGGRENYLRV